MAPAEIELLSLKLDRLQDHLGILETKEDLLLKMLDQVQQTLELPSVVEPRFPKWVMWLSGTFFGVSIMSSVVLMSYIFMK